MKEQSIMDGEREKLIFNGSNVSYSAISGSSNQRMGYSNSRNKSTTLLPAANTGDMYVKDTSTKALMRKRVRSEADLLPSRRVNRLNHEWRRKLYVALPFTATFGMTSKEQRVKRSVSMDNSHMLDGEVLPQVIASMDAYESALTLPLLAAVVLSMISQFLVGYNTSVMNAPQNVVFPQHTTIEWSLAVSAFAIGGPFGAFFGGKLANVHGRKGALLLNAWVFLVGGLIMTLAQSIYWLIPGRFVVGFASGVSSVVVPIYLGEIAPPTLRGTLGTCTQFAMVIGILVSSLIAFPLATESCWRYLFLVTPALCVAQLLSAPFVVESPRWLLSKETEADEIDKDIKPTYTPKNPFDPQPTDDSKTPPNSHSHPPTPYLKGGAREVIRKLRGYRLDEEVDEEVRSRSVQELVVEEEEEVRYVPPPRSGGLSTCADQKVDIRFTPRVFPTPMRESKAAEEEDWVAKNRRHLKNHGVLGKSNGANVTEEDPVWLKAKGDDFFRAGDMRSALNAYSAALDADPRMLACLANRSVCQLRCGAAHECRLDCSAALLQIESEGAQGGSKEANVARHGVVEVKLLMRRGTACCQLGAFTEALTDFHQALSKFQHLSGQQCSSVPGVSIESLGADIARLKIMVDAEGLKKQGDALFAENTAEAMKKYTAALALVPVHVGCLSNRAALRMALQDFEGCCEDCGLAVALLQSDAEGRMDTGKVLSIGGGEGVLQPGDLRPMLSTVLPPPGSAKRTQWTVKTLLRRGVALAQLQRLDESASDYARASALDPSNEAIRADLTKICSLRDQRATGSMNTGTVAQEIQ
mmetsp:Transcript_33337/g.72102  ORF Transcript_33337/g.72102 Transcript_33337/m.72102 type:complete len:811 (+) Transcript_33337:99-2531(+)